MAEAVGDQQRGTSKGVGPAKGSGSDAKGSEVVSIDKEAGSPGSRTRAAQRQEAPKPIPGMTLAHVITGLLRPSDTQVQEPGPPAGLYQCTRILVKPLRGLARGGFISSQGGAAAPLTLGYVVEPLRGKGFRASVNFGQTWNY